MYQLTDRITQLRGVGEQRAELFHDFGIFTIKDFLTYVPMRYEDRSQRTTIAEAQTDQLVTLAVTVEKKSQYYKGKRSIQRATVSDSSGSMQVMWFNNKYVLAKLEPGEMILMSGKKNNRGVMIQPVVEKMSDDAIHTDRLVPMYSSSLGLPAGTLRRLLKQVLEQTNIPNSALDAVLPESNQISLAEALSQIHFPDSEDDAIQARQRLALEELVGLIAHSHQVKAQWQEHNQASALSINETARKETINQLPFTLTNAQLKAWHDIAHDLQKSSAMNRLLIGDVGAGKTIVAALALQQSLENGHHACLVAPTQILAEQHAQTLQKLLPATPQQLVTSKHALDKSALTQPTVIIGTHSVLNRLEALQPAVMVFDEQHRFGVSQRSVTDNFETNTPHVLTMSATPIPRSLMLTIFSHLQVSHLDELPAGRQPTKTWLIPPKKRTDSLEWIAKQLAENNDMQALIVCPFIKPSTSEGFEHISSVAERYQEVATFFKPLGITTGELHSQLGSQAKEQVTQDLFAKKIRVLVTTPVIEVGLDLPQAGIIAIESAERFGLASLHQLRGRVGRAGQQGYCIVVPSLDAQMHNDRLKYFSQETNGLKLAEFDIQQRGAGDLFGTQQSGFDQLQFASWTNLELIEQARTCFEQLNAENTSWHSFFDRFGSEQQSPVAN